MKQKRKVIAFTIDAEILNKFNAECNKRFLNKSKIIEDMIQNIFLKNVKTNNDN